MYKVRLVTFAFYLFSFAAIAQDVPRVVENYVLKVVRNYDGDATSDTIKTPGFFFNALAIKCPQAIVQDARLVVGTNEYAIERGEHTPNDGQFTSELVFLEEPGNLIIFKTGNLVGPCELYFINSVMSEQPAFSFRSRLTTPDCSLPESVDQSSWRSGLPDPNYTRSFSNVKHVIVHHSAGSNSAADYVEEVRAIYIYHTQVNGWSDIGYNYLIDPNGVIYKGRDPATGEQSDVVGAHFCGKNTGTMGICMLGTYTSVQPTQMALASLNSLITWKMGKEVLDPQGAATHSGITLASIAGHRDGCATECPGQQLYDLLPMIRTEVQDTLDACANAIIALNIYPLPVISGGTFYVDAPVVGPVGVSVLDIYGRKIDEMNDELATSTSHTFKFPVIASGIYFIWVKTTGTRYLRRVAVLSN